MQLLSPVSPDAVLCAPGQTILRPLPRPLSSLSFVLFPFALFLCLLSLSLIPASLCSEHGLQVSWVNTFSFQFVYPERVANFTKVTQRLVTGIRIQTQRAERGSMESSSPPCTSLHHHSDSELIGNCRCQEPGTGHCLCGLTSLSLVGASPFLL